MTRRGDRRPHREQGTGPFGRGAKQLATVSHGPLVGAPGRAAVAPAPRGRTYKQLYEEARHLDVSGRSNMNKDQLRRAVDRKKTSR